MGATAMLLCAFAGGCAGVGAPDFETAASLPKDERRPDGIAVDLTSSPPPTQDRADSRDALVTLRTPLGVERALETARAFFDAIVREDIAGMAQVAQPSALIQDLQNRSRERVQNLAALWRERFRKHEHQDLAGRTVYRESDVRTFRGDQAHALPPVIRYLGPDDESVEDTDIILEVPIAAHTIKNERLLGDEMFLWLRRDGDRFVIYRVAEAIP